MLKYFRDLFSEKEQTNAEPFNKKRKLQISSCALFIELAQADDHFSEEEKETIIDLMKSQLDIGDEEINEIIKQSEIQIENSVSAYEFTEIINARLNNDEKYEVVKNLWRIAFVDGHLDKFEDYYIRKISNNLHLSNQDRISAKLEVKDEMKL